MNNTKKIVTSSIMVALAVVLSLILYFLPFFQFAIFIVGVPIVILGRVSDIKMQLMASVVMLGILMLFDPSYAVMMATLVIPLAIVQGYMFQKQAKNSQNILYSTLAMVFGFLAFMYSLRFFFGIDFLGELTLLIDTVVAETKEVYRTANLMPEEQMLQYFAALDDSMNIMLMLFPSLIMIYSFINAVLSYATSKKIMERMQITFRKTYFRDFRINKSARMIILLVLGIVALISLLDQNSMTYYVSNFMNVFNIILHINGMAFLWYLFEKQPNKTFLKVTSIIMYLVSPVLGALNIIRMGLGILGFVDMYADFRKRIEERTE